MFLSLQAFNTNTFKAASAQSFAINKPVTAAIAPSAATQPLVLFPPAVLVAIITAWLQSNLQCKLFVKYCKIKTINKSIAAAVSHQSTTFILFPSVQERPLLPQTQSVQQLLLIQLSTGPQQTTILQADNLSAQAISNDTNDGNNENKASKILS